MGREAWPVARAPSKKTRREYLWVGVLREGLARIDLRFRSAGLWGRETWARAG